MLLADSACKVGMLFNGALIRLFWAGVAADLEFDYVDDNIFLFVCFVHHKKHNSTILIAHTHSISHISV